MRRGMAGVAAAMLLGTGAPWATADVAPEPVRRGPARQEARMGETPVRMAAEEVTLTLSPGRLDVEAVFHMHNPTDADIAMEVGFPQGSHDAPLRGFTADRYGVPFDVSIVDRNIDLPREQRDAQGEDFWIVWDAVYPAGKTVTETVRYRMDVTDSAGYILHTGAGWAGTIGRAQVTLHLAEGMTLAQIEEALPLEGMLEGLLPADGTEIRWVFEDLEPTEAHDIRIRLRSAHRDGGY